MRERERESESPYYRAAVTIMEKSKLVGWRQTLGSGCIHRASYENNNNYIYRERKKTLEDCSPLPGWILSYVIIAVTSFACYVNNLRADFVHDDVRAILANPDVRRQDSLAALFRNDFWGKPMADKTSHKSYRPITVLSFR